MKKNFVKVTLTMVAAFVFGMNSNAQEVVNNISTSDFGACKEYLADHPTDTIRSSSSMVAEKEMKLCGTKVAAGDTLSVVINVYKTSDGKIARHTSYNKTVLSSAPALTMASRPKVEVTSVVKDKPNSRVGAVTAKKDTVWFDRMSSAEVSHADKIAVNRGEKTAIDPEYRDMEGKLRHRVYLSFLGGGTLLNNGDIHPMFSGILGYETCHFLFELNGVFSQANYTPVAEVEGRYNTFAAYLTAGWKFWQSPLYRSYLAVGASGGFAYQKTDVKDAEFYSSNYGAAGKVFLRAVWGLNRNFGFVFEGGYQLLPWVEHFGGEQDWGHGGAYFQAGVNCKF